MKKTMKNVKVLEADLERLKSFRRQETLRKGKDFALYEVVRMLLDLAERKGESSSA